MMMSWHEAVPGGQAATTIAAQPAMDSAQFAAFYERSARPLWAYLVRCSGDPALADDLMQEAYVRFLSATVPTDGEVAARRYLFRIASNLLRDHWRKPRASSLDDLPESFFATSASAEDMAMQQHLARAMAEMAPRERQILWLAHAENYSHREIAEIMGVATASVKLLLFRARRRMRTRMGGTR
ncbi:MAG TPA: sigma-70 family RNA polymerase sigma factor [Terriglobus sp.]